MGFARQAATAILSVRTVQKKGHFYPPIAILNYGGVLVVLAFTIMDFVVSGRYSMRADATVSLHAQPVAGRVKSRVKQPSYCNDSTLSYDTSDAILQAVIGRICATNVTCGYWFSDQDIFFASGTSWTLATYFGGAPFPSWVPDITEYNIAPLLDATFPTLNATARAAVFASVFGTAHLFTCAPSYFAEKPETVTLAMVMDVKSDVLSGGHQAPTVRLWGSDGSLVAESTTGIVSTTFGSIFAIDYTQPSFLQRIQIPSSLPPALRPTLPPATVRHMGLEASLAASCTNFYDNAIQAVVVCDVRAEVNSDSLGVLPKTTLSLTDDGINYRATPLSVGGVSVAVTTSATIVRVDLYAAVLWAISTLVIIDVLDAVVQMMAKIADEVCTRLARRRVVPELDSATSEEITIIRTGEVVADVIPRKPSPQESGVANGYVS